MWDKLPPAARFVVLLLTVATFHLMGAVVSLHSETKGRAIHTIATLSFQRRALHNRSNFNLDDSRASQHTPVMGNRFLVGLGDY